MTGFDFDDLEREEVRVYQPLVVHEDAEVVAAPCATSGPTDEILWHSHAEVARAVAFFGPGALARPLLSRMCGARIEGREGPGALVAPDWGGLEAGLRADFGGPDPQRLADELAAEHGCFEQRLAALEDQELRAEVLSLQDWQVQAHGRLGALERRAAWALLGIPITDDRAAIARAFKRRALELHPDKGGDAERFQLLQELKDLLIIRGKRREDGAGGAPEEGVREAAEGEDRAAEGAEKEAADTGCETESGEEWEEGLSDLEEEEEDGQQRRQRKRRRARRQREESEDEPEDLQQNAAFDRERYEAARRKLHARLAALWERTGRLAQEIGRSSRRSPGSKAVREFRKFVTTFASEEVSKLRKGDPRAEALLHRFLELGAEMVCAAGAVDTAATVSTIVLQVTGPLLSLAPSPALRSRCGALLKGLEGLAAGCRRYAAPLEAAAADGSAEAQEEEDAGAEACRATEGLEAAAEERRQAEDEEKQRAEVEETPGATAAEAERQAAAARAAAAEAQAAAVAQAEARAAAAARVEAEAAAAAAVAAAEPAARCRDLAVSEKGPEQRLRCLRTKWDIFWDHPCAGDRRDDGSGIFCCACDRWIFIGDPYDHQCFEQHCQKAGHENWIYGRLGEHAPALVY